MEFPGKSRKDVDIADHLWAVFHRMAAQMGVDRDALINQAMFMFARVNGFLESEAQLHSAASKRGTSEHVWPNETPNRMETSPSAQARAQARASSDTAIPYASSASTGGASAKEFSSKVFETAAELEKSPRSRDSGIQRESPTTDEIKGGSSAGTDRPAQSLYLVLADGKLHRIEKERFVIGRGKHCDCFISSGKVSREHALVVREFGEFFIEDLGSSNGTWYNKQRIRRRRIEDGDEYFICSDQIKFIYR